LAASERASELLESVFEDLERIARRQSSAEKVDPGEGQSVSADAIDRILQDDPRLVQLRRVRESRSMRRFKRELRGEWVKISSVAWLLGAIRRILRLVGR